MGLIAVDILCTPQNGGASVSRHRGCEDEALRAAVRKRFGRTAIFVARGKGCSLGEGTTVYKGHVETKVDSVSVVITTYPYIPPSQR